MLIAPLLPPWPEKAPGPRPVPDSLCLQGILYVLHNDIARQLLPLEPEFGSGHTCWRRLERRPPRPCGHHRGPGHASAVTGAPGSATAEGADRR
ncbi:transposase [Streptomyces sp. NBC_01613]|uniref:transposase n=1 Tax=Streptomyces sp. NBC_01613 TaxID=2975896 RepID=UPI003869FF93